MTSVDPSQDDEADDTMSTRWVGSESPSNEIVEDVASFTGQDPLDLPPLYDAIDTDSLDQLLTAGADPHRSHVHVRFEYAGVSVTVRSDRTLLLEK